MEKERTTNLGERIQKYLLADQEGRRDLCSVYKDRTLMKEVIAYLAEPYRGKADYVAAPESVGFILGSMMAEALDVGFIAIRNGSVSVLHEADAIRASYIDHRDRVRSLQIRNDSAFADCRILLVDDWVETAATIQACMTLVEEMPASTIGIAAIGVSANPATDQMVESGFIRHIL